MTQYDNLKDYIELNNKRVIFQELCKYVKYVSDGEALHFTENDITIHTLAWNNFESETLSRRYLTFTIGVSVHFSFAHSNDATLRYYNIAMRGNIRRRLSDLQIIDIFEVSEEQLQKETVLSLFGLPNNITADTLEDTAERFYKAYCPEALLNKNRKYALPVINIKNMIGCKMYYAELPEDCLGMITLNPTKANIYDTTTSAFPIPYPDEPIPFGTILLNYNYYRIGDRTDDIIVSAHEIVHWHYHQAFYEITCLLDDTIPSLPCANEPILPDDSMTVAEQAYWYAEWQANELAVGVAMPRHLIEEAIAQYARNHKEPAHTGAYYEKMIEELSWDFNVPAEVMKKRFRQLGYDFADGTMITGDNGENYNFTFAPGALQDDETFVIDRANYEKLLREDNDFADLIETGRYIYLGYTVCLLDSKYVTVSISEDSVALKLTAYASEHVNECCIKFRVQYISNLSGNYFQCGHFYLSKIDEKRLAKYEAVIPSELKNIIDDFITEDEKTFKLNTYSELLSYYLFEYNRNEPVQARNDNGDFSYEANRIIEGYSERFSLSVTAIKSYLNSTDFPKPETAIRICFELGLDETQSRYMLEKSGNSINTLIPDHRLCRLIFKLSIEDRLQIIDNWKICSEHIKQHQAI